MSGITDTATVTLNVNGTQAKQMMADIKAKIKETENTIDSLKQSMADPKTIEKANRQLKTYRKQLDEMDSAVNGVKRTFETLDEASPRQLEKTLRTLNKQLKDMTPGTEVWDSHVEKIRQLKERLADIKDELGEQRTAWGQFKEWALGAWPAIDLLDQWGSNIVDVMRGAVDAYAEMDQEMANVRKFTGMTEEQVASLNEELKNIDTRTSREDLNKLAQEAGRLGKTSQEDILGFVRAADKINVALDDLGKGATLTLSKLTGIFGDEQRYGTEQSLLKVGSVINELSQNCSASAPYLAEFASRMGGVGSQAGMTIQQIMGFGAVLDSNAQQVEAASTALSQVIVRLYQDPAKYARVAGLDVEKFSKLMREDANSALILFLETLQKAGGMDVLSPMFKDMGENGSRAITALSTLATHIDQVKAQQEAANVAFAEGTSIDKEFAVQNTTVQAGLEKCRKAVNELRVELGSYLAPVMSHILTSSSAMLKSLAITVKFLAEHKGAVMSLAAAMAAYTISVNASVVATKAMVACHVAAEAIFKTFQGAIILSKAAIALLSLNITRASAAMKIFNATFKANPIGLFISLVTLAVGAVKSYRDSIKSTAEQTAELNKIEQERKKALTDLSESSSKYASEETSRLERLNSTANDNKKTWEERLSAANEMKNLYPAYLGHLSAEEIAVGKASSAYRDLASSILEAAQARAAQDKVEENQSKLISLGMERGSLVKELEKEVLNATKRKKGIYDELKSMYARQGLEAPSVNKDGTIDNTFRTKQIHLFTPEESKKVQSLTLDYNMADARDLYLRSKLKPLDDQIKEISEANAYLIRNFGAKLVTPTAKTDGSSLSESATTTTADSSVGSSSPDTDRFAEEKAWRERAEAEARISYSKGEATYSEHTERMAQIAATYYSKLLGREDVSGDEKLKIRADYWEAVNRREVAYTKQLVDEENSSYEDTMASLKQNLSDRLSIENLSAEDRARSEKIFQEASELAELNHLARLVDLYEEGSDERLKAQQKYQEAELAAQKRHQQDYESQEAKYAKIKSDVFGDNPTEKKAKYDSALAALTTVYDRELAAAGDNAAERLRIEEAFLQAQNELRREYGQQSEEESQNSYMRIVNGFGDFLKSDKGKALTGTVDFLVSGMSSVFSGLSSMVQAELEIQTASIEKRYDKEIQLAQGNSYKVAQLEKKKEAEISKAKNKANKKMFTMQVIQAVAQSVQSGLNAYSSTLAIPIVGPALAPAAMALALATGAIQVAALKKQQQAAEAQGYAQGGFTKPGAVNEPAGIVHAGEWVASQRLLASPVARPMIEALDYAQRTNTIGSLRADDVSRSITANNTLVRIAEGDGSSALMVAAAVRMSHTVDSLTERLNEPFVTVNTVTGDRGIKQAQDEYSRLVNNVTSKRYRK